MQTTPNIQLELPDYYENVSRTQLNSNMTKIDTAFGWTEIGRTAGNATQTVTIDYSDYRELCLAITYTSGSSKSIYACESYPIALITSMKDVRVFYITDNAEKRTGIFNIETKTLSMTNSASTYYCILYAR